MPPAVAPALLLALNFSLFPALAQTAEPPPLPGTQGTVTPTQRPLAEISTGVFTQTAASFLQLAVEASRMADAQTASDGVRTLAANTAERYAAALDALAETDAGAPATGDRLMTGHRQQLLQLSSASGADFDRAYLDLQLQIHRQMREMFDLYATSGADERVSALAAEIAPDIEAVLVEVEALQAQ